MFYVGQEVVCINARNTTWTEDWVQEGKTYTISHIWPDMIKLPDPFLQSLDYVVIELVGISKPRGFASCRFRPIQKKKTDISIFTAMLDSKQKELIK